MTTPVVKAKPPATQRLTHEKLTVLFVTWGATNVTPESTGLGKIS